MSYTKKEMFECFGYLFEDEEQTIENLLIIMNEQYNEDGSFCEVKKENDRYILIGEN